jgi:hypothetical protein
MIWSPARNFCFVHVPKTGGTAIQQAYRPHLRFGDVVLGAWRRSLDTWYTEVLQTGKHSSAAHIAEQIGQERFRHVLSFAILRDPLDRLVSYYRWIQSHEHPGELERWLRSHRSFDAFVEPASEHFPPQADLVCEPDSLRPMVTVLAPYARLAEAWGQVCRRLGIGGPLPVANASFAIPVEVTEAARALVARRYARDLELLARTVARWEAMNPPARQGAA